jgi:ribosomal-protein-alanine N-acetyltransferase
MTACPTLVIRIRGSLSQVSGDSITKKMHGACDSDAKRRSRDASGTVEGMSRAVVLRTARLTLRAFRVTDVEDALAYRNDPEFSRFLRHIPQPFTRADAEAFVQVNMTEPWETLPTFAVVHDDRVIGTVNFNIDPAKRRAMIGYAIARAYWGGGIALEAASAAIEWAVAEHGLTEIWASTDNAHVRSRRVLEKLGMTPDRDERQDREVVYRSRRRAT